jgi:dynein heavy chain
MYPALINNTTIDWFMGWPADALTEVANKFIGKMGLEDKFEAGLAVVCSFAHSKATENALKMKQELNRIFYVTPTNYIELLKGYNQILSDKRKIVDFQRNKLRTGLSKLDEAKI